ncbi:hypothetical protein D1B31_09455 [Neobacillus notoginsengisoli]|uniref:Holin n=1 Tax=Neobacillus notoginsengisoli TaxID=1578198 RepID=A0A417YVU8_9BACI|nr:hypothetical protein [Neobacillus notoginsengisoli]RHW41315.1 hypothetical protein D1B31_09455 [Neobacillus notoginsengisoli]
MEFPVIHTNIWDVIIAVPAIIGITQLLKLYFKISKPIVPTIALAAGLLLSVLVSHQYSVLSGLFMGWFYGYAAIGSYAAMKTSWKAYRKEK